MVNIDTTLLHATCNNDMYSYMLKRKTTKPSQLLEQFVQWYHTMEWNL